MSVRRMLPFLLLNIVVSATVVLGLLYWWESRQAEQAEQAANRPAITDLVPPTLTPQPQLQVPDTPEPTATAVQNTYAVQTGDTLGNIGDTFGVSVDDIMTANGITDPNFLQVGQELIIPEAGFALATETPPPTETPAVAPTPIATVTPTQGEVVLEIREVVGVNELVDEAISLVNVGSRQVGLLEWTIVDESGFVYTFDQVTLFGGGAGIFIHTETGQNTALDLYWGLEAPVWEAGETVTLIDAEGTVQATYTIPADAGVDES